MRNKENRPAAHIRHKGIMIDASFRKDGTVEYYVVQGSSGRFYGLRIAKEIAEGVAKGRGALSDNSPLPCSHDWGTDSPCALVDTCRLCGEVRA